MNEEYLITQMQNFIDRGMKPPEGNLKQMYLDRMSECLRINQKQNGSKRFQSQLKKFADHIEKFASYHKLPSPKENEPCTPARR